MWGGGSAGGCPGPPPPHSLPQTTPSPRTTVPIAGVWPQDNAEDLLSLLVAQRAPGGAHSPTSAGSGAAAPGPKSKPPPAYNPNLGPNPYLKPKPSPRAAARGAEDAPQPPHKRRLRTGGGPGAAAPTVSAPAHAEGGPGRAVPADRRAAGRVVRLRVRAVPADAGA